MSDGTRRLARPDSGDGQFLAHHDVRVVVVEGKGVGSEHALSAETVTIGRYEAADLCLDDDAVSGIHAAIELGADGFRVRDMGSTNGTFVNGKQVQSAELEHGDRISLGEHTLQFLQEEKERVGSHDLSDAL